MRFSIREAALDLDSVCVIERVRIEGLEVQARRLYAEGYLENSPNNGLQGLRTRLDRLKRIAWFLSVLAEHEPAVRLLDQRLHFPPTNQADAALNSSKG